MEAAMGPSGPGVGQMSRWSGGVSVAILTP